MGLKLINISINYNKVDKDTNYYLTENIEDNLDFTGNDMDCFFRIGNTAYHFASNGYKIPDFISYKENLAILHTVEDSAEYNSDIEINETGVLIQSENIKYLIANEWPETERFFLTTNPEYSINSIIKDYALSYEEMAAVGFISMDLTEDGKFYVIAKPAKSVPKYILDMLPVANETVKDRIKEIV